MRAKEAKKVYPVRLKKCRPHRARPFGAGLERQHGRRASPTADERRRSYEESRESYRELLVPGPKKARFNMNMHARVVCVCIEASATEDHWRAPA